jgi:hypothetical protein
MAYDGHCWPLRAPRSDDRGQNILDAHVSKVHTSDGEESEDDSCGQVTAVHYFGSPSLAESAAVWADTPVSLGSFCGSTASSQKHCGAICI